MKLQECLSTARRYEDVGNHHLARIWYQDAIQAGAAENLAFHADISICVARCHCRLGEYKEACAAYYSAWRCALQDNNEDLAVEIMGCIQDCERDAEQRERFYKLDCRCCNHCVYNESDRAVRLVRQELRKIRKAGEQHWFAAALWVLYAYCKTKQPRPALQEALDAANRAEQLASEWPEANWLHLRITQMQHQCRPKNVSGRVAPDQQQRPE